AWGSVLEIAAQGSRVVSADEGEELLVALLDGGLERPGKQGGGNSLTPLREVHVGRRHAHVIECMGVSAERFHALEADDPFVGRADGDVEETPRGELLE